jgi:hypothetical protein
VPCSPINSDAFHPPISNIGGFAVNSAPLNISIPELPIDDLEALFSSLSMILPPGIMRPGLDADVLNKPLSAFLTLLEKFTPFLMLYKFFLPILNLILCIIEVLCSIPNPFKLSRAIRRLFRQCLPEFLALFPFFAIILMIIALILLIIALIEYLIERILQLIAIIIQNIKTLSMAAKRLDNDSIIGITKKIGDLLCLFQNLFVVLGIIALIVNLMKSMLSLSFRIPPCDSSSNNVDGCCSTDVCPSFLKNNGDGITRSTGNFLYYGETAIDSGLTLPPGFAPILSVLRSESWQFYDPSSPQFQEFINIVNAFDLPEGVSKVFFPEGATYKTSTSPTSVPYTIDFRLFYNPGAFGVLADPLGPRFIKIKDAIIQAPPTDGTLTFDGKTYVAPFNGTLNLVGGTITEDDDTIILNNGNPITLNDFFHAPLNFYGNIPNPNDAVLFSDITYTFKINYEVLISNTLITIGCMPDVAIDRDFINTTIGAQFNVNGFKLTDPTTGVVGLLPDAAAAQQCVLDNVNTFRQSISIESATAFQNNVLDCLSKLKADASTALTAVIAAGFDQYKSTFSVDPSIQFTTRPIILSVALNEGSGNPIATNLPADTASVIAGQLSAIVSLGSVSPFTYDGYTTFNASIESDLPGNGTVKVLFNNNFISTITNPATIDQSASVAIKEVAYTFVHSSFNAIGPTDSGQVRRDETDVAKEEV